MRILDLFLYFFACKTDEPMINKDLSSFIKCNRDELFKLRSMCGITIRDRFENEEIRRRVYGKIRWLKITRPR